MTAARPSSLKQSTSVATEAALAAALHVCRLAVAAVFSLQHDNTARHVAGNTQRASKFKNNLGVMIALGVYLFLLLQVIFMIKLFFIALRSISISHHLQIAFSLLSPCLDICYSAATLDARGTFAEEHIGFGAHVDE